jgi:hypothetical protein
MLLSFAWGAVSIAKDNVSSYMKLIMNDP